MIKIIYDLGAGKGENLSYYLLKADLIIAVEANPENYIYIKNKFKSEISKKKIILINSIITDKNSDLENFYVHKSNYLLGQYPKPENSLLHEFEIIKIQSINILDLISKYGQPYYIKIDLEKYDDIIFEKILTNKFKPDYISVEATNQKIIELISLNTDYISFKIVEGNNVEFLYKNTKIKTIFKTEKFSFPKNSAGPFGNDIDGDWIDKDNFIKFIEFKKLGWRDIHCSKIDKSRKNYDYNYFIKNDQKREKRAKLIKRILKLKVKLKKILNQLF